MINTLTSAQVLEGAVNVHEKFASVSDALAYGLPKSLFGFAMVFFVLMLLWGILTLLKVFFYTIPNSKKNATKVVKKEEKKVVEHIPVPVKTQTNNDGEIVAAIIAAIEAYRAQTGYSAPGGFKVVSFKKRI